MNREEYNKAVQDLWKSDYNFHEECKKSLDLKVEYIDSLEQRNTELEQRVKKLEEPKTCRTCKHSYYWHETDIVECSKNEPPLNWETMKKLNMFEVTYNFGCINYEPK